MERKLVTVLFVDAVGSTSIADQLDPERLRAVQDAYFDAMSNAVTAWGGTVEKFIGDAVMAVFGVPVVREDDAARALSAATDMLEAIERLNSELLRRHGITMSVRIGVNTGEVVATPPTGDRQRLVSGEPVNIASRLQAEAAAGSIMAGERTYLAARNTFAFGNPMSLTLKGKSDVVQARRLLGRRADTGKAGPGIDSPLVGRTAELETLANLLDAVLSAGHSRLVTIAGPAGVGKSRIVREFIAQVRKHRPGVQVLNGRCLAAGHGITYWALGEILRAACGIQLDEPTVSALEKLRAVAPDQRMLEALASTAGINVPGSRLGEMTPQAVAEELAWAWPRFASRQSEKLAIWVIEDLHWAGDPLLEMVQRIVAGSTGTLLLLATARPDLVESHPGFGGGSEHVSSFSLQPLSARQSQELLRAILAEAELPTVLSSDILSRAGGNPFFLEEIVRRLVDEGVIQREHGRWMTTVEHISTPLPDSLLALLSARIDSLPEQEKLVLQEAAVIGYTFWAEPLERAVRGDLAAALRSLEDRGLVSMTATSSLGNHPEYAFKHMLVRDVAYGTLPKARRARAHAEVGSWLEELAGDRSEELGELLAYHYMSAVAGPDADLAWSEGEREPVRQTALRHLLTAGAQARRRFAIAKSLELHEQAAGLAANVAERMAVLEEIGDDHESAYQGDDSKRAYAEALDLARDAGNRVARARICAKLAEVMTGSPGSFKSSPDPEDVEPIVSGGLAQATDPEVVASLQISFGQMARLYRGSQPFGQGHKDDAVPLSERIALVERAVATADSLGSGHLQWRGNAALGILYGMAGRHRENLNLALKVLPLVERIGSRIDQGDAVRRAAVVLMNVTGNYPEGLRLAWRSLELSRGTNPHQLMHGTNPVMVSLYELGRWDEVQPILDEHLAAFQRDPAVECDFVRDGPILGALVAARSGQQERARKLAALLPDPISELERATAWQSRLAVALGQPEVALMISEPKALHRRSYGPDHARSLLEARVALEDWAGLERLVPLARQHVDGLALLRPCCDRAEALVRRAKSDEAAAKSLFAEAVNGFEALRAASELVATRRMMASGLARR